LPSRRACAGGAAASLVFYHGGRQSKRRCSIRLHLTEAAPAPLAVSSAKWGRAPFRSARVAVGGSSSPTRWVWPSASEGSLYVRRWLVATWSIRIAPRPVGARSSASSLGSTVVLVTAMADSSSAAGETQPCGAPLFRQSAACGLGMGEDGETCWSLTMYACLLSRHLCARSGSCFFFLPWPERRDRENRRDLAGGSFHGSAEPAQLRFRSLTGTSLLSNPSTTARPWRVDVDRLSSESDPTRHDSKRRAAGHSRAGRHHPGRHDLAVRGLGAAARASAGRTGEVDFTVLVRRPPRSDAIDHNHERGRRAVEVCLRPAASLAVDHRSLGWPDANEPSAHRANLIGFGRGPTGKDTRSPTTPITWRRRPARAAT